MLVKIFAVAAFASVLTGAAAAQGRKVGDLLVSAPWARATIGAGSTGTVYLTIENRGAATDWLVAAATPTARVAHLHQSVEEGGVIRMRQVGAIKIAPGDTATLEPGGRHVMLMGLSAILREGDRFPLTLTFERAGAVEILVRVGGATAGQAPAAE